MEENRAIKLQQPEMAVKISEGMKPLPTPIKNNIQRLIARMRKQGKSDRQIQNYFLRNYKVDLIYV